MSESTGIIEEIQQDLMCPGCQYNLRGLHGSVVQCPECGRNCDVAEMISRRWTKPWHRAPGYNRLAIPVAIMVIGAFGMLFVVGATIGLRSNRMIPVFALFVVVASWIAMLVLLARRGGIEVLLLSLLAHLVYIGYVVGGLGLVIGVLLAINGRGTDGAFGLVVAIVGPALFVLARLGEKFIARRCIKRYLENMPEF